MDAFDDIDVELKGGENGKDANFFGVMEVDSDVNDDGNREKELDESFGSWVNDNDRISQTLKDTLRPGE
ncbi:hypothetical protein FE783_21450 [Paenibacillus mesophilus]|uniref:hypothetical protein n=1 Tax=Paenibacillus mesophilus TaxID=2582849 RepID=UPI00110E209B|nr:hypothetical protein [Paenibacillus mesophilus]TMV47566.1 hypothetical protein FE783_21450 [Paenibacillus mesophilus]